MGTANAVVISTVASSPDPRLSLCGKSVGEDGCWWCTLGNMPYPDQLGNQSSDVIQKVIKESGKAFCGCVYFLCQERHVEEEVTATCWFAVGRDSQPDLASEAVR